MELPCALFSTACHTDFLKDLLLSSEMIKIILALVNFFSIDFEFLLVKHCDDIGFVLEVY